MPSPSTRAAALKAMTKHSFVPGAGYLLFSEAPGPMGPQPGNRCYPPNGTVDGSAHLLTPPGGAPMRFMWVDMERAWARPGGKRMAFAAEYLSSLGFVYVRPALEGEGYGPRLSPIVKPERPSLVYR